MFVLLVWKSTIFFFFHSLGKIKQEHTSNSVLNQHFTLYDFVTEESFCDTFFVIIALKYIKFGGIKVKKVT
jgi:hypothetical protein